MARRKKIIIWVLAITAYYAAHEVWNMHQMRIERILKAARLRSLTSMCDRLIIDFNTWPAPHDKPAPEIPLVDVNDPAKLHELLNALEYKSAAAKRTHACYGDARITLFQGKNQLAVLHYEHGTDLNWRGEPARLTLTSASIEKLNHWRPIEDDPEFGELLAQAQRERFEALRTPKATTRPVAAVSE